MELMIPSQLISCRCIIITLAYTYASAKIRFMRGYH